MSKIGTCIYQGSRGIYVPNTKFLCLILWLGGPSTDNTNGERAGHQTTDKANKPNEPKMKTIISVFLEEIRHQRLNQ